MSLSPERIRLLQLLRALAESEKEEAKAAQDELHRQDDDRNEFIKFLRELADQVDAGDKSIEDAKLELVLKSL